MKKLKFILLLTVLLTTFSCQSGKQKVQSKEENGQLESAAAMLYKADSADVWNEPIQLDNNELHQVAKMMESFPVLSYKIDYIKFYTPVKNEVKCTIVMQKGGSGTPIATSSWYFKLMNYLGGWRLCMMNQLMIDLYKQSWEKVSFKNY